MFVSVRAGVLRLYLHMRLCKACARVYACVCLCGITRLRKKNGSLLLWPTMRVLGVVTVAAAAAAMMKEQIVLD